MAKENGLGAALSLDDSSGTARVVSNDTRDVAISTPKAHLDTTGIDKSAMERIQLLTDGQFDGNFIYNDTATTGIYQVLKTIAAGSVQRQMTFTVSANALAMEMMFNDMKLTRGGDGSLLLSTHGELSDGSLPTWG